jgi:MFS family permease
MAAIRADPIQDGDIEPADTANKCLDSDPKDEAKTLAGSASEQKIFPRLSTPRAIALITLIMLSSVLQVSTGIGVAINTSAIGKDLMIPAGELQWIGSSSALATACTLLLLGRLADMYGHKSVFIIGCSAGSALLLGTGFAQNKYQLFVFRAFAGCAFAA